MNGTWTISETYDPPKLYRTSAVSAAVANEKRKKRNTKSLGQNFHVQYQHEEAKLDDLTFSLVGLDTSIANALRRILIAEVSTLAIEKIYLHNNTSVIQDEVLCSRLGLIPLTGNKSALRWM